MIESGCHLLGKRFRPCDADFDWHADPDLGPLWPATVMDDADAVRRVQADVKLVWEVNRMQYLAVLAAACAYENDPRYGIVCADTVTRWIDANPHPLGVNWSSNLEVAMRTLAWVWTLQILLPFHEIEEHALKRWLACLRLHRDHLATNLSVYTDPTNHLIGEAAALAVVSMFVPEWPDSESMTARALEVLDREFVRQVDEDGWDREQSTSYQRFVSDFALQVLACAKNSGVAVPPGLDKRTKKMVHATSVWLGTQGTVPQIGDTDGARGIPFFTDDFWNFEEAVALGESVSEGRPTAARSGALYESAVWLAAGGVGEAVVPQKARTSQSPRSTMAGGGYAILRDRADVDGARLIFDCGPLGLMPHATHGHADMLAVLVETGGSRILSDSGTYAYYDADGRRNTFRSTRTHNTIEVGGMDQADAFDPFKWLNIPRCEMACAAFEDTFDYVEAWHNGYQRLRPAVIHRRGVLAVAGGWLLIDWLEGCGEASFARRLHAPPECDVRTGAEPPGAWFSRSGRAHLRADDIAHRSHGTECPLIELTPYSEVYGDLTTSAAATWKETAVLPALRITLLANLALGEGVRHLQVQNAATATTSDQDTTAPAAMVQDAAGQTFEIYLSHDRRSVAGSKGSLSEHFGIVQV